MPSSSTPRRPRPAFHAPVPVTKPAPPLRASLRQTPTARQRSTKVTVRLPRPLGVSLAETRAKSGDAQVVVSAVHPQGAAAGLLHVGDVVVGLEDKPARSLDRVVKAIRTADSSVTVVLQREAKERPKEALKDIYMHQDEAIANLTAVYVMERRLGRGEKALGELLNVAVEIVKMRATGEKRSVQLISNVLYKLKRGNVPLDERFYNLVMWSFVRAGAAERAVELFEEIERPNVECFTTLVKAYSMLRRPDDALGLVGRMRREGVRPNIRTYNALIASCVRGGKLEKARMLFSEMLVDGVQPNAVSWNIIIHWHVQQKRGGKRLKDALKAFADMKASGVTPNLITFTTIMKAYAKSGLLNKAEEVFGEMKKRLVGRLDTSAYNTLLTAYSAKLDWRRCMELLDEMRGDVVGESNSRWRGLQDKGLPRHSGSFSQRRPWFTEGDAEEEPLKSGVAKTLKRLDEIEERKYKPDAVSYSLVVKACAGAGRPLLAQQVFDEMMEMGFFPPPSQAVVSLMAGYANVGMLTESFNVVKNLKSWGVFPEERMLSSLMHACLVTNQPELALSVYARFKSANFDADVVTNTLLLKAYGMSGELDKAFNVLKGMRREGSKVVPNLVTYNTLIECSLFMSKRDMALKALDLLLSDDNVTQKADRNTFYALTLPLGMGSKGNMLDSLRDPVFDFWQDGEDKVESNLSEAGVEEDAEAELQYLMDVLRRVREGGAVPNGILYRALLETCETLGEWHLGKSLVLERENGVFVVGRKDAKDVRVLEDLFRVRSVTERLAS